MAHTELLSKVPLFESLDDDDIEALAAKLEPRAVAKGDIIFRQHDDDDSLFIIEDGAVEITYEEGGEVIPLVTLFEGQYFGELSMIDGAPRSATATATRPCTLLELDRDDLVEFLRRDPAAALLIMGELAERLRNANQLMASRVTRNVNEEMEQTSTLGQRVADRVASFGGSWPFIFLFGGLMITWMTINVVALVSFDPYPFILLNLALSSLAALQAPVIMMSQNRQAIKDSLLAENDYRVNLKSEMEIARLLKMNAELLARMSVLETQIARMAHSPSGRPQAPPPH